MSSTFRIDCQWLEPAAKASADRHFLAEVGIEAEGVSVTALADEGSLTYRPRIRVSAYDLAAWFVANWWRLRWEPLGEGISWSMSHRVGGAGSGFLWPDLEFVGGETTVQVRASPVGLSATSAVRFLNGVDVAVPAHDFEAAVREFIETVTSRSESLRQRGTGAREQLPEAWCDLKREIKDSESSLLRIIEARMGFDAEEAESVLLDRLCQAANEVGVSPIQELAASSKDKALVDFETLWGQVRKRACPLRLDLGSELREASTRIKGRGVKPWMKGAALARTARQEWSLGDGAIEDRELAELCGVSEDWIRLNPGEDTPIPAGFRRDGGNGILMASLQKRHPTARRFALARIIGEHLLAGPDQKLLPVTDAATDRQKFQRVFGQAFLCPIEALRDYVGFEAPDDDLVEDAAQYFHVSSWLIRSALVNHGVLSPDMLAGGSIDSA